ncbi:MAG: DUF1800 domain-containing protein [Bacteroidetes bacterium]|nr:DUF1800 domain-containing protein [Bacteroidota bacterium]
MAVVGSGWSFAPGGPGIGEPGSGVVSPRPGELARMTFPYRKAGLTERQAAAHLLSRFTYGPGPGQVDAVVRMGLEKWFARQLDGSFSDDSLIQVLDRYDALKLTNEQVVSIYPRAGQVVRMAIRDGVVNKDSVKVDRKEYRDLIQSYMQKKGYKREQELFRQLISQKILRAAYSQNQLREVMTDFWFNHFNVSITKNDCAEFIPAYERDVIRPSALGSFGDLLLRTARSPAMLYYLDNFTSSAPMPGGKMEAVPAVQGVTPAEDAANNFRRNRGLNENYAREVMELHTLGVDGGYTQLDVTQAARVLTGWGVYPMTEQGKGVVRRYSEDQLARRGFVHDGDFFFNANRHDKGPKTVLGHAFPAGGGYEEGVELLEMLAHHPSTAAFITRKIAVRFVSDDPPQSLLDKMAKTFREKNGDIRQVLITMVTAPEFWNAEAVREKTKSPFELAIGAVRSLHAIVEQPLQLYTWIARMGEKQYYYQAPTGFPDKGAYWINTGSLLNRMNFGLAVASGRIPGVRIDLAALNNGHEPESAVAALETYGRVILPERDLGPTIKRLTPMLTDPALAQKVDAASPKTIASNNAESDRSAGMQTGDMIDAAKASKVTIEPVGMGNPMLAQVVGIIIGSPEYQRR